MSMDQLVDLFAPVKLRYDDIYVIVSPPRCSSTAFARMFWEQPTIGNYSHEPFEVTYYQDQDLEIVLDKLLQPLDLRPIKHTPAASVANGLVIKEMPYQVGNRFTLLAELATLPVLFLMRDPRINVYSRILKKIEVGDSPIFPLIESGWELLAAQVEQCAQLDIPYHIIDAADFRNRPLDIFPQVFALFDLPFREEMLTWRSCADVFLDNLDGQHRHLYEQVLRSESMQPEEEPIPPMTVFPETDGFREHVQLCLDIYRDLRRDPQRIV